MFHYLSMLVVGLVAGAIARFVLPGADSMGWFMTAVLGIAGSFVGGFLSRLFSKPAPDAKFHPAGFLLSVVGAIALLVLWRMM